MPDKTYRNPLPNHLREDGSEGYQPRSIVPRVPQRDVEFFRDYDSSPHWLTDEHGRPIGGPYKTPKGDY